jgi:hypothetical protein
MLLTMTEQEERLYRYMRTGNPVDLDVARYLLGIDHLQETVERLKAFLGESSSCKIHVSYNEIDGTPKTVYRLIDY